ncbi:MAG: hypothetical protein ACW99Q_03460, partial [Candidatus Kariarchaeaceae archaeon]
MFSRLRIHTIILLSTLIIGNIWILGVSSHSEPNSTNEEIYSLTDLSTGNLESIINSNIDPDLDGVKVSYDPYHSSLEQNHLDSHVLSRNPFGGSILT